MRSIQVLLLTLALSPLASAQSFHCLHAKSPREHAICFNTALAALDNDVAAAYDEAHSKLSHQAFGLVQDDQRTWLRWLDMVCPRGDFIANCLTWHYNTRLDQLTRGIVTVNGMTFYPRAQYSFAHDPRDLDDREFNAPGFSSDESVWPQIDKPATGAQVAWNAAFRPPQPSAKQIRKSPGNDDPTERSENSYNVIAANNRLIDISFTDIVDSGGAHPFIGESSNLWWLDRRRKLIASDVFRPDSGWQQKLIASAIQKLHANYAQDLSTGPEVDTDLRQAAALAIARVDGWSLTSTGLTITFAQLEVGPRSLGTPDISFTWDELKPYLAPDLDPETLPAPIPTPGQ